MYIERFQTADGTLVERYAVSARPMLFCNMHMQTNPVTIASQPQTLVRREQRHRTRCQALNVSCRAANADTNASKLADTVSRRAALTSGSALLGTVVLGHGNDAVAQTESIPSTIASHAAIPRSSIAPSLEVSQVHFEGTRICT